MGLIKRRLILFRVFIKTHYKENFFEPHLDLRRSTAPGIIHTENKCFSLDYKTQIFPIFFSTIKDIPMILIQQ
jgi:hypothetical protein